MRMKLESAAHGSLDLDDVFTKGVGVQALRGATGLGLPDVKTQWLEAAGNGSLYRGSRYLARDIDLPLYLKGSTHAELVSLASKFSRMLSGKCVLRLIEDDGTEWTADVRRVGGGDYSYGVDTVGGNDLMQVITLRSGSPFWAQATPTSTTVNLNAGATSSEIAYTTMVVNNSGDTDVYPTIKVEGPVAGISISPTTVGAPGITWSGAIYTNEYLVFDFRAGTVVDQAGVSRFAELGSGPNFFSLAPGSSTLAISGRVTPAGTSAAASDLLKNWALNPSIEVDTSNWQEAPEHVRRSGTSGVGSTAPTTARYTIVRDTSQFKYGTASLKLTRLGAPSEENNAMGVRTSFYGLDPERKYSLCVWVFAPSGARPSVIESDDLPSVRLSSVIEGTSYSLANTSVLAQTSSHWGTWAQIVSTPMRPSFRGTLWGWLVNPANQVNGNYPSYYWDGAYLFDRGLANANPGEADFSSVPSTFPEGFEYFDGSTVRSGFAFAWTGTPHKSTSTGQRFGVAGQAKVTVTTISERQMML